MEQVMKVDIILNGLFFHKCPSRDIFVPVAQCLEHCVSSAKVVGSIPRERTY